MEEAPKEKPKVKTQRPKEKPKEKPQGGAQSGDPKDLQLVGQELVPLGSAAAPVNEVVTEAECSLEVAVKEDVAACPGEQETSTVPVAKGDSGSAGHVPAAAEPGFNTPDPPRGEKLRTSFLT